MENDNVTSSDPTSSLDSEAGSLSGNGREVRPAPGYQASQTPNFRMPLGVKIGLGVAVVVLSTLAFYSSRLAPTGANPSGPTTIVDADPDEIAKRAPVTDFILTDADKKQQKLSDFHGNVVILSFWASWCTPCLLELPTFAEIEKRYHDRGLRVLAVNVDEGDTGKTFAKDFWTKEKFTFPSFFDSTKQLEQQFEVDMLPSTFVIDRDGRLAFSGFGANDWSNQQTKDFIESLLAEKPGESNTAAVSPETDAPGDIRSDEPADGEPGAKPAPPATTH